MAIGKGKTVRKSQTPAEAQPPAATAKTAPVEVLVVFLDRVNDDVIEAGGVPAAGVAVSGGGLGVKLTKAVAGCPTARFICAFVPPWAKPPRGWLKELCQDDGRAHGPSAVASRVQVEEFCGQRTRGSWVGLTIPRRLFDATNVLASGDSTLCLDDALSREGIRKVVHGGIVMPP